MCFHKGNSERTQRKFGFIRAKVGQKEKETRKAYSNIMTCRTIGLRLCTYEATTDMSVMVFEWYMIRTMTESEEPKQISGCNGVNGASSSWRMLRHTSLNQNFVNTFICKRVCSNSVNNSFIIRCHGPKRQKKMCGMYLETIMLATLTRSGGIQ